MVHWMTEARHIGIGPVGPVRASIAQVRLVPRVQNNNISRMGLYFKYKNICYSLSAVADNIIEEEAP
jgi:hypothetical protein